MPQYKGTLEIDVQGGKVDVPADIFDTNKLLNPVGPNRHNIALDPVTHAILRAIGLNLNAIARIIPIDKDDDGGISIYFRQDDQGPHTINLPDGHPSINGQMWAEHFINCGNGSIDITLLDGIYWYATRSWPTGKVNFQDRGTLSINPELIPASAIAGYQAKAGDRSLTLNQVIAGYEIPENFGKIFAIYNNSDSVDFAVDFETVDILPEFL